MFFYILLVEIFCFDFKKIIDISYLMFCVFEIILLVYFIDNIYFFEFFYGFIFVFKDVVLQFLGNFFEYFLVRKNEGKIGRGKINWCI